MVYAVVVLLACVNDRLSFELLPLPIEHQMGQCTRIPLDITFGNANFTALCKLSSIDANAILCSAPHDSLYNAMFFNVLFLASLFSRLLSQISHLMVSLSYESLLCSCSFISNNG